MESLHIHEHIGKEKEGSYYTIPFTVPPGVESFTLTYSYPRLNPLHTGARRAAKAVNIVDLGLEDAQGQFIGWSGSARSSVCVGPHSATQGYRMAVVRPGTWRIIVGAYHIPNEGLEVEYTVRFSAGGPRWLFGDFHVHSTASDGQHSIYRLCEKAQKKGLDFIAAANHNNYAENQHLPVVPGLTLVPAVEWTHYKGHMNFFGPKVPFEGSFVANSEADMQRIVRQAKGLGALVSVNHPKCGLCPYLWGDEACFDAVEVWNGPMRGDNMRALAWWDGLLRQGRRLPAIGGSDYHRSLRPVRLGNPVTAVWAASAAAQDILAAVREGRCYVTQHVNGARLQLGYSTSASGGPAFGRQAALQAGEALQYGIENAPPGTRLAVVTNHGAVYTVAVSGGAASGQLPLRAGTSYAYLLATRPSLRGRLVCAVSSPVYFGG